MTLALAIIGTVCLAGGVFFCVVGGIGLLRFPDFYSRCHAAGMTDSAGAAGVLVGLCFFAEPLVIVKLLTVVAFIWMSSVVSTHALVKAAYARGIRMENPRVRDWTVRPDQSAQAEHEVVVPSATKTPSLEELALGADAEVDADAAPELARSHGVSDSESDSDSDSESDTESDSESDSDSDTESDSDSESESESESESDSESELDSDTESEDDDDGEARS